MDRKAQLYSLILELNHAADELKGKSGVQVDHQTRSSVSFAQMIEKETSAALVGTDEQWEAVVTVMREGVEEVSRANVYPYGHALQIKQWLIDNRQMAAKGYEYQPNPLAAKQLSL